MARRTGSHHWHTQNFLRHPALARALIDRAQLTAADLVYEIGAGTGTITAALAERCRAVIANEIDGPLCEALRRRFADQPNVHVRCGDFLGEPLPRDRYKVFANPPFDITAAIVTRLAGAAQQPEDTFLVVQREAAARYSGMPHETLASLLLKPFFTPSLVHEFRREDFVPTPTVEVVMLRLRKRGPPLISGADAQAYRDLVVTGLTAWTPTLGAALGQVFGPRPASRVIRAVGLDPALRPSAVPFSMWLDLFAAFRGMPDVLQSRVAGAEARLRRQQAHLQKQHRTRAPRDALGSGTRRVSTGSASEAAAQPGPPAMLFR